MLKEWSENSKLKDLFIQGYFLEESFCDKIVEEYKGMSSDVLEDATNTFRGYMSRNLNDFKFENNTKNIKYYFEFLDDCLLQYSMNYRLSEGDFDNISLYTSINFQHWSPGNSYSTYHCEKSMYYEGCGAFRELVFMTYLQDSEDGYTDFPYQKTKIYPKKGLTILWPSSWMFAHKGTPSKKDRYCLTGWYMNFPYTTFGREPLAFYSKNKKTPISY